MTKPAEHFRILIVGDVHGHWDEIDTEFVENGDQDLLIFIGDLGDEDVEIVQQISEIDCELGVLLGNHDAWESFSTKQVTPRLRESLDLLGEDHLAYTRRELPEAGVSMIGVRPFSWGGRDMRSPEVYGELYGVRSHEESAEKIIELASRARHDDLLIIAHNGPKGLGSRPGDIWGKDFGNPGGDWGDKDLKLALAEIRRNGQRVRALIGGHMHDRLIHPKGAMRRRFIERGSERFINSAVVPRIRKRDDGVSGRYYLRCDWRAGRMASLEEIWVNDCGVIAQVDPVEFNVDPADRV